MTTFALADIALYQVFNVDKMPTIRTKEIIPCDDYDYCHLFEYQQKFHQIAGPLSDVALSLQLHYPELALRDLLAVVTGSCVPTKEEMVGYLERVDAEVRSTGAGLRQVGFRVDGVTDK